MTKSATRHTNRGMAWMLPGHGMASIHMLLAALSLLLASCTTVPEPQSARFKILQINDVYKIEGIEAGATGGLARVRTLRKHLESDGTPVLVLHAGDALYPSVMSKYLDARPMVAVMNLLDGDAAAPDPYLIVTFGNHEFDQNDERILLERLSESAFRWVASNTLYCKTANDCDQPFPSVHETQVLDMAGTRIGVFGLLLPTEKEYVKTTDGVLAASRAVESLRENGARVIIAVTHQDMRDDVQLVESVPGIDLVIGGHDHVFMQQRVGGAWITKADADAKSSIVYDVTVPPSGGVRTAPLRVVLDSTVPKDPTVDAEVQRWLHELASRLGGNETIGTTKYLLEGVEPAVRGRETALGNLLADVAREQMQTDVAVINGGGIRLNDNIPPGPITKYDMEGIFYYQNMLVAFRATGQQLLDMLRNSVSQADSGDGRFLQVSGLRFRYHPQDGNFVVNPEGVEVNGRPLNVNAWYTVATVDYLYKSGARDGYMLFAAKPPPPKIERQEVDFRTAVEEYIRRRGQVQTDIEGRIVRE
jgi:2',3'-cyclic-nucleotide 2'-phosphodiesterase (5'-nucleotidase family)